MIGFRIKSVFHSSKMRRNLLIKTAFGTLLFASVIAAQQADSSKTLYSAETIEGMKTLQSAALNSDYAYLKTRYLTNNIGPRLSGSPQSERAIEYVADEMRKLGLEVRLQPIMVPHWVRGEERASLVRFPGMAPGTRQKLSITALGGSTATPEDGLTAEVVVVQDFDELRSLGKKSVQGRSSFSTIHSTGKWRERVKHSRPMVSPVEVRRRGV